MIQRRTAVAVAALAAGLSMLAGCGFEAPSVEDHEQASVQATDFTVGALHIDDTSITADTSSGTAQLYLVATIVNDGTASDTLKSVTTSQGTISLAGSGTSAGSLAVPPGVPVEIALPSVGTPGPTLAVTASPSPQTGAFVPVQFTFARAGQSATIQVPVIPAGETTAAAQPVPSATASVPTAVGASADD